MKWVVSLLFFVLTIFVNSCHTRYVPVETVRRDSVVIRQLERDSIFVADSVVVYKDADTVRTTQWHWRYRDRIVRDTVRFVRCDTIAKVVEVERELSKMERVKLSLGEVFLWVIIGAAVMVVLWFVKKFKGV